MANAEIKVKIKAYDEGFAAGMQSMRKETERLKAQLSKTNQSSQGFGATLGSLKGAFGTLGAVIGGGTVAMEAFKRTMEGTQSTSDTFASVTEGLSAGVDHFFQTLADGDWSNFLDGLSTSIEMGRQLYDTLDTLGDMQWAFGIKHAGMRNEYQKLQLKVRDESIPLEERKQAMAEFERMTDEFERDNKRMADKNMEAFAQQMSKATGLQLNSKSIELYRWTQEHEGAPKTRDQKIVQTLIDIEDQIKQVRAKGTVTVTTSSPTVGGMITTQTLTKEAQAKIDELNRKAERIGQRFPDHYNAYKTIEKLRDGERDKAKLFFAQSEALKGEADSYRVSLIRLKSRLSKEGKQRGGSAVTSKGDVQAPVMSADFAKEISEEGRRLIEARKPTVLPIRPVLAQTPEIIRGLEQDIERLQDQLSNADTADKRRAIKTKIAQKQEDISEMKTGYEIKGLPELPKVEMPKDGLSDVLDANMQLVDSFGSLGSAIAAMAGESDNAIVSITQWVGTLLSSIGTAIPAITTLTALHKAKATAQAEDAVTGAGASVANIPVVGAIMAVSAIAGVIAAMANMPKFATGGVVRGASHTGDKILARLNAGELVLNTAQQTRLGQIIDRADAGGGAGGRVEFKIRGEELVGVLSKHGRRTSRT